MYLFLHLVMMPLVSYKTRSNKANSPSNLRYLCMSWEGVNSREVAHSGSEHHDKHL